MYSDLELVYDELPGWDEPLNTIKSYDDLPKNCKAYLKYIEDKLGVQATIISVGPKREETIVLKDPFKKL
jgi:adenylosuccinate synthase